MQLSEKQRLFHRLSIEFQAWALAQGYEFTYGEAHRTDEQTVINTLGSQGRERVARLLDGVFTSLAACLRNNGKVKSGKSVHPERLALDLNLFIKGVYQTDSEAWRPLGEKWESMHALCRWGGRFSTPDGNHISFEHNGVK